MDPAVTLPFGIGFHRGDSILLQIPANITIVKSPTLDDYKMTVAESSRNNPRVVGIIFARPFLEQAPVYALAALPLVLVGVVGHMSLRRRPLAFDPQFIAGLIAVVLTILPLRAVLVPTSLGTVGLTFLDELLVISILAIAAFVFAHYAVIVTKPEDRTLEGRPNGANVSPPAAGDPEGSSG
ncbi:hypothetical protein ACQEV9_17195 [Streptomyces chartreusis]|uniref:hypothetical protein n=1 Tax=Streptomyces chartreusis TaxID=1969 RepID=UPI003D89BB1B